MSSLAVEKAQELHRKHPGMSVPVDIERLVIAEGCELVDWPFLAPVKEVKCHRWIGIAQGLNSRERRHLIAHALAHHLLHCGNQLSFHQRRQGAPVKQEREAEAFAAHILMPGSELSGLTTLSVWDLADYFDVPEELAHLRITEFSTEQEKIYWESISEDECPS
jgi:Zn-dependent peptidase ImmA (M78 family)